MHNEYMCIHIHNVYSMHSAYKCISIHTSIYPIVYDVFCCLSWQSCASSLTLLDLYVLYQHILTALASTGSLPVQPPPPCAC